MARRVFFSFHYGRDIWRANQVRNSWVTQDREAAGFFDASLWEKAKTKGQDAIERLIDGALQNTSVTVVLIGSQTAGRRYITYEIKQSFARGNAMLGVYIHRLEDMSKRTDSKGDNPFDGLQTTQNGRTVRLSALYKTYDWVADDGYKNFGTWVEAAATAAGK